MKKDAPEIISFSEFQKVVLQVGTVIKTEKFPEARKPSYKLWIRFGEGDIRKSSAQITANYTPDELLGKQVICVTNFAPRQIANFMSEVLITGMEDPDGNVVLAIPDKPVPDGKVLF